MVRVLIPEHLVERAEEVLFRETTTLGFGGIPWGVLCWNENMGQSQHLGENAGLRGVL
ncbi:MAG: hypothetical protein ACLR23_15160 [Clostridia bacterium]